ncbi:MAG: FAD-dependent oxidoreductase, partial [Aeromonas sp.]
ACLDQALLQRPVSCLVNPLACRETELVIRATTAPKRLAVVGGGVAGLAFACVAAERGHQVTLFEQSDALGGQFNLAARIPGKSEFAGTVDYFAARLARAGGRVQLHAPQTAASLHAAGFAHVVLATGLAAKGMLLSGLNHPKVVSYSALLQGAVVAGPRVAVIGAGGIGVDVAQFLAAPVPSAANDDLSAWQAQWGIDASGHSAGGLCAAAPQRAARQVWLLQRSAGKVGRDIGKTTAWVHRAHLAQWGVTCLSQVAYLGVDDAGLHIEHAGQRRTLAVDHIVLCTGQTAVDGLHQPLVALGITVQLIGGAAQATPMDARLAIQQAFELAARV